MKSHPDHEPENRGEGGNTVKAKEQVASAAKQHNLQGSISEDNLVLPAQVDIVSWGGLTFRRTDKPSEKMNFERKSRFLSYI